MSAPRALFPPVGSLSTKEIPRTHIDDLPNELLSRILSYLIAPSDVWGFLLTQRRWFMCGIAQVWMRPLISQESTLLAICKSLAANPDSYAQLIRRLNLGAVSRYVSNSAVVSFVSCHELERLALNSAALEDERVLCELIASNPNLSSVDFSNVEAVSDISLEAIAEHCAQSLHGLYALNCAAITDCGIEEIAGSCKYLRRLKIAGCPLVSSRGLEYVVNNCPYMLELDISGCTGVTDQVVRSVLTQFSLLRELRVNGNLDITANVLNDVSTCDSLRLIDFGACNIADSTVERLAALAPRLHHVVLGKCFHITDRSLRALATLKLLHYVHLGHCVNISDAGVALLTKNCTRLHYVDVANCTRLTNDAVASIAQLPHLRRIGLVKCQSINDEGIMWLANRQERTLERIHLSYCNAVSFQAVVSLINACPRLTHLSLTGVTAFMMRSDLAQFCREPPPDLNQHQQAIFCVFSGKGVKQLREYINRPQTPHNIQLLPTYRPLPPQVPPPQRPA